MVDRGGWWKLRLRWRGIEKRLEGRELHWRRIVGSGTMTMRRKLDLFHLSA
jgi:hypothetical protein